MAKTAKFYGKDVTIKANQNYSFKDYHWHTACLNCNREFTSRRKDKQTCSDSCRVDFNRKKKRPADISLSEIVGMLVKHLPPDCIKQMRADIQTEWDATTTISNGRDLANLRTNTAMLWYIDQHLKGGK